MKRRTNTQHGFTILELMVAMGVFSVILLLGTIAIMRIGQLYYKGVNSAKTQEAARNVINDFMTNIEFDGADAPPGDMSAPVKVSKGPATATAEAWCIGSTRYSWITDMRLDPSAHESDTSPHVLWKDTLGPANTCVPVNPLEDDPDHPSGGGVLGTDGQELLQDNMRLAGLEIEPQGDGSYLVDVEVAFGPTDLLTRLPDGSSAGFGTHCRDTQSTQYCATSSLDTYVTRRVN